MPFYNELLKKSKTHEQFVKSKQDEILKYMSLRDADRYYQKLEQDHKNKIEVLKFTSNLLVKQFNAKRTCQKLVELRAFYKKRRFYLAGKWPSFLFVLFRDKKVILVLFHTIHLLVVILNVVSITSPLGWGILNKI